jgi:hypothetical protein
MLLSFHIFASRPNPRKRTRHLVAIAGKKKPDPIQAIMAAPITILMRREVRLTWRERIPAAILSPPRTMGPVPVKNKKA